jgi:hypothetical protein
MAGPQLTQPARNSQSVSMKVHRRPLLLLATALCQLLAGGWALAAPPAAAARGIAEILAGADLNDPLQRSRLVAEIQTVELERKRAGVARAQELKMPLRLVRPDGTVTEVAGVTPDGSPLYFITHNVNAAISTGASLLRASPYNLKATGISVGLWDGGSALTTHQEFTNSRVTVGEAIAPALSDHATHVAGTIAAAGTVPAALGMAPEAKIISYDWNSDISEMTSRGASAPNQAGRIYLSNHSYGFTSGWYKTGGTSPAFVWYGSGTAATSIEPDFGQYNSNSRDSDALAYSAPYYLIFRSAGNDRTDNPTDGQTVQLSSSDTTNTASYNSTLHPPGDGSYRGGYDTISFDAVAKNVITVGSVADAVTSSTRDLAKASMSSFSSWGPTDDGRIKPDVVANGEALYSSLKTSTSTYGTYSGTSMATPSATGTAALLIEEYAAHFPNGAMRSSTLKGLLIHTADDLGAAGPDYRFGWGLINGKAAADLIRDHAAAPLKKRLVENSLTSSVTSVNHDFIWDGVSPIRVTLCWTDAAGSITADADPAAPSSRLRNNLDVKITDPNGTVRLPYVMPFVGTWTQASMSTPATTGVNNTDNVEQIFLPTPPAPGIYRVVVSLQGTLYQGSAQPYSLLVSGSAETALPLAVSAVSPDNALAFGTTTLDLTGTSLASATQVKLTRAGSTDITASNLTMIGSSLRCSVNLTGAAAGTWNVVASSPTESATLPNSFSVASALFFENFDNSPSGWTASLANSWSLSTAQAYSPASAYFIAAPASKILSYLSSPAIVVGTLPAGGAQLKFWHRYDTQANQDGGRLELSVDNGSSWFSVESANSGASFSSNGYNSVITQPNGNNPNGSAFAGLSAWSGSSNGFIQTIVNLTSAKFSNKTIRLRWAFATDGSTASTGWFVDSVSLTSDGDTGNAPPLITTTVAATGASSLVEPLDGVDTTYFLIPGTTASLTVAASDDSGTANLTYSWAASGPAGVGFSPNGGNAANATTASFEAAGDYVATVTVTDPGGLSASSTIRLRVVQTTSAMQVTPSSVTLAVGASQAFQATTLDQFAAPMASQPASLTWTATGGGSVSSAGLFSAASKGTGFSVTASATVGGSPFAKSAEVNVTPLPATITLGSLSQTYSGAPKSATATTSPGTYPVTFTYDGSPSAPSAAGIYAVQATVDTSTHEGSAQGSLTVDKASATVTLSGLNQAYDGGAKSVTVTTTPSPLNVVLTYAGAATAPSAVGSYAVAATVNDANYQGSATGTLTITPSFLTWQDASFSPAQVAAGEAAPTADADRDGTPNLAEYALGTDPNTFTAAPAAVFSANALTLTFTRPKGLADVTYSAESSAGLGSWSPVSLQVISSTETSETVQAEVSRTEFPGVRFLRLRFAR